MRVPSFTLPRWVLLAYPYPDRFGIRVEEMRVAGLIRLPKVNESLQQAISESSSAGTPESGQLERCEPLPPAYFRFAGWVRNPIKHAAGDYVVLGWEDVAEAFHPFNAIPTGIAREDLAGKYCPASLKAGFDQDIETARLPPEAISIKAWAIDWEGQQAFPLEGDCRLEANSQTQNGL